MAGFKKGKCRHLFLGSLSPKTFCLHLFFSPFPRCRYFVFPVKKKPIFIIDNHSWSNTSPQTTNERQLTDKSTNQNLVFWSYLSSLLLSTILDHWTNDSNVISVSWLKFRKTVKFWPLDSWMQTVNLWHCSVARNGKSWPKLISGLVRKVLCGILNLLMLLLHFWQENEFHLEKDPRPELIPRYTVQKPLRKVVCDINPECVGFCLSVRQNLWQQQSLSFIQTFNKDQLFTILLF